MDKRAVINPAQADQLLEATRKRSEDLVAFFGCMYYSALRPEEVHFLSRNDYTPPTEPDGWGSFQLAGSTVALSKDWNGTESIYDDRALKRRAKTSIPIVPVPPDLVALLDHHFNKSRLGSTNGSSPLEPGQTPGVGGEQHLYPDLATSPGRRLRGRSRGQSTGAGAVPVAARCGLSVAQCGRSGNREVAEWAGHSVNVLLRVYAACIDGEESAARARILAALIAGKTSGRIPDDQRDSAIPTETE